MPRPLLIGVGNLEAGDDSAGRRVAHGLKGRNRSFDIAECQGMAADLMLLFEGRNRVLIVDACLSGSAPGTIHRIDASDGDVPPYLNGLSSHGMGVAEAIRLSQALSTLPRRCDIWAIEGVAFGFGTRLTPAVSASVTRCVADIPGFLSPAELQLSRT